MNATEIGAEIARLQRQMSDWLIEGRLDSDVEAEIIAEIEALQEDLFQFHGEERLAPTGGFNVALFTAAMGATPEEIFGETDPAP